VLTNYINDISFMTKTDALLSFDSHRQTPHFLINRTMPSCASGAFRALLVPTCEK